MQAAFEKVYYEQNVAELELGFIYNSEEGFIFSRNLKFNTFMW